MDGDDVAGAVHGRDASRHQFLTDVAHIFLLAGSQLSTLITGQHLQKAHHQTPFPQGFNVMNWLGSLVTCVNQCMSTGHLLPSGITLCKDFSHLCSRLDGVSKFS